MQLSNNIFYEILSQQTKTIYTVIDLLDWDENLIGEIQGKVTDGSLSLGNSAIRRTVSMGLIVDETNFNITKVNNHISLGKKVRIKIGVSNEIPKYKHLGEKVWFKIGTYILTDASLTNDVGGGAQMSINAIDKMGMLSGEVGGQIQSPTEIHIAYEASVDDKGEVVYVNRLLTVEEMIRYAVIGLGGENPARVIISDVPRELRSPIQYKGKYNMYYDANYELVYPEKDGGAIYPDTGEPIDPDNLREGYRVIKPDDYMGYELVEFTYPGEMVKQPGDSITSILDDIKNTLGNYEYFYDVDGNFIFQEVKNYVNTSFTPLVELTDGDYIADFTKTPVVFSFKDTNLISSYSNAPDWKNIKNDFIVWGRPSTATAKTVMYHLAIDDKPVLPPGYTKPWQQYLVEYGDNAIKSGVGQDLATIDPGRYYNELKGKWQEIYNAKDILNDKGEVIEKEGWKSDPPQFSYYLDFIDSKSEFGQYSINTIGKRTISIIDDNVTMMYAPNVPDIFLMPKAKEGTPEAEEQRKKELYLTKIGANFIVVRGEMWGKEFASIPFAKDAFGVIRDLLFMHTTFNETISITSIPMYFLDVNQMIEVEDSKSNIYGSYLINSISLPLGIEGTMNISAIRSTPRI